MAPTPEQLAQLARLAAATEQGEIDCEEELRRVAAYLAALKRGDSPGDYLRQVARHIEICPECHEEFLALIRAEGLDPKALLGTGGGA